MGFKKKHYRPQVDTRDCGVARWQWFLGIMGHIIL